MRAAFCRKKVYIPLFMTQRNFYLVKNLLYTVAFKIVQLFVEKNASPSAKKRK